MKKNRSMIIAFTVPATVLFLLAFVYPVLRTIVMSFFTIVELTDPIDKWVFNGLGNYKQLLQTPLYVRAWTNLFKIFFFGGIITLGISLIFALILSSGIRGKRFYQNVIYLPNIVSAIAMATMWIQYVFHPTYGFLRSLFSFLGWEEAANFQWLSGDHKFSAMLISYCFGTIGYYMLIWISGIKRIDEEYYEAAKIDGANGWQEIRYITLPLLKGILRTNLIMWSISVSGFFVWAKMYSPISADISTVVPMVFMYEKLFGTENVTDYVRDAGLSSAVGVMLTLFIVILFIIFSKTLRTDDLEF